MIPSSLVVTSPPPPMELLWLRHSPSGSNLYGAAHARLTVGSTYSRRQCQHRHAANHATFSSQEYDIMVVMNSYSNVESFAHIFQRIYLDPLPKIPRAKCTRNKNHNIKSIHHREHRGKAEKTKT